MGGRGAAAATVLPGLPTVIPALYRHSRVSGNPERCRKDPSFALQPPPDSRLRGNDGGEGGMTVGRGGR